MTKASYFICLEEGAPPEEDVKDESPDIEKEEKIVEEIEDEKEKEVENGNYYNANNAGMEDVPVERMDSLDGKHKNHGKYQPLPCKAF